MAYVEWDDSLKVNIKDIDSQHHKLFTMINELHQSTVHGQGSSAVSPVLTGLVDYVKVHFDTEEKLMKKYEYPDYDKQKQEHDLLISKLKEYIMKYKERSPLLARGILLFLGEWARNHVKIEDLKYKSFFIERGVK